jgi:hypothetical protein
VVKRGTEVERHRAGVRGRARGSARRNDMTGSGRVAVGIRLTSRVDGRGLR